MRRRSEAADLGKVLRHILTAAAMLLLVGAAGLDAARQVAEPGQQISAIGR